ncbi:hypothetical protein EII17_14365 [Clostridiales bacterium COT073_COT-073]|nr:hypothetical protein EII17_14365 [Clostridiales bacterium COT073_COT-073]
MNYKEIKQKIEATEIEQWPELIDRYEAVCPDDLEIFCMRALYFYANGDYQQAISLLTEAERRNPYFTDALYNLAMIYQAEGDLIKTYEYFYKLCQLEEEVKSHQQDLDNIVELLQEIHQTLSSAEEIRHFQGQLQSLQNQINIGFGRNLIKPWNYGQAKKIGTCLRTNPAYYIASYTRLGITAEEPNIINTRVEIRKMAEIGEKIYIKQRGAYCLPLVTEDNQEITMLVDGQSYQMKQNALNFSNYRLEVPAYLSSPAGGGIIVAEPIPLQKKPDKKSLVLTVFVDGLSQAFLEEYGFAECMPKTHRYFADGIYCTNFYTTGEWTYPSMAAYFSGQYTTDHKMFYPAVDYRLPENVKVLGECFKEAGYHTTKIDGDWRTNPDYGYIRGMDRVLTATYGEAMNIKEVIYEAMDHMRAMKETNQYLYLNIGELHDITDNYKLPFDVQMNMDLVDLQDESNTGTTSVKQQFNAAKKRRYYQQMHYVDRYLGILFQFLEEEFAGEDILVTLFSDHGQGYLVPNGEFFLADERAKVPLLIKGASREWTVCEEYMSIVDYLPVIGKLAGFEVDLNHRRSQLPAFFGGQPERKYVHTESLYPGDTYKIALRNADLTFFFESKAAVQKDARVDLSEYEYSLQTPQGGVLDDPAKAQECLDYVMHHIRHFRIY